MADRKISVNDLAEKVGIAPTNLTRMRTGKIKGIRFSTMNAICKELRCQPGDILIYVDDTECRNTDEGNLIDLDFGSFDRMES